MALKKRSEPKFISSKKAAEVFADMNVEKPATEKPAPAKEEPAVKEAPSQEELSEAEESVVEQDSVAKTPSTAKPLQEEVATETEISDGEPFLGSSVKKTGVKKQANRLTFLYGLFFFLSIVYMECVLKLYVYGILINRGLLLMILFSAAVACIFAILTALAKGKIVPFLLLILAMAYIMIQAVYYTVFSTFLTLYSFSGAGDVSEFWKEALNGIGHSAIPLLLLILPLIALIVFRRFHKYDGKAALWVFTVLLIVAAAFQVFATVVVYQSDDDVMSEKYLYTKTFIPTLSVNDFGALTTLRLDLKNMIFGMDDTDTAAAYEAEEAAAKEEEETVYADNVLDIDFDALAAGETDATIKDMDEYFASVTPTAQNEYTGMFEGKNLIWIVAEGFSTWALDENLTPTLYQMANESFVFKNYYNPIWGVSTSDGEYTACTGLLPKTGVWSMSKSADNDMAFCMGNQLSKLGYLCNAYHDHTYTYYNRDESHPNMGYNYIAKGNGLEITSQWPESDLEMMENTVNDYINSEPFHIYYMTVSGHLEYNFGGNCMAKKHEADVADLDYSEACKAYIACQMEFDQAMEYLINTLDEAGVLDDTLIVISGDHYPYGLTTDEINELNGSEVEQNFELYHSTLIMWNSVLAKEDPVVSEEPCYAVDILPTLSNLFGVDYDSRLLMGRDIFSTASPLVVFSNHSWLTDEGRYNAVTGEFTANKGVMVAGDYVQNMMDKVNSMFSYSAKILDNDYYSLVVPDETDATETEDTTQ